jgi:hypothetical protein
MKSQCGEWQYFKMPNSNDSWESGFLGWSLLPISVLPGKLQGQYYKADNRLAPRASHPNSIVNLGTYQSILFLH